MIEFVWDVIEIRYGVNLNKRRAFMEYIDSILIINTNSEKII